MASPAEQRATTVLERTVNATIEEVWELWTTAAGIESWWGPEGFETSVRRLELRPGGSFDSVMTAVAAEQAEFLRQMGMPASQEVRATFTELDPPRHLAFNQVLDFVPGVEPYEVATSLDLLEVEGGVRVVVRLGAMHDAHWGELARQGMASQLDRLAARFS
jgi:uncharacterized protein YndB with AHSA1/START domain